MKHEESVDLKRVSKIAKVNSHNKVIQLNNGVTPGIKMWGRLDYLCNILGYRIIKSGIVIGDNYSEDTKSHNREIKKQIKANKANNNMAKKNHKKK